MPTKAFLQGGGIVDAVADHAHRLAVLLAGVDVSQLILRQAAPLHLWDAQLAGDVLGGVGVVPGEEDGLHPPAAWVRRMVWAAWGGGCPTGPGTRPASHPPPQ